MIINLTGLMIILRSFNYGKLGFIAFFSVIENSLPLRNPLITKISSTNDNIF
jgi:hypothetical protein